MSGNAGKELIERNFKILEINDDGLVFTPEVLFPDRNFPTNYDLGSPVSVIDEILVTPNIWCQLKPLAKVTQKSICITGPSASEIQKLIGEEFTISYMQSEGDSYLRAQTSLLFSLLKAGIENGEPVSYFFNWELEDFDNIQRSYKPSDSCIVDVRKFDPIDRYLISENACSIVNRLFDSLGFPKDYGLGITAFSPTNLALRYHQLNPGCTLRIGFGILSVRRQGNKQDLFTLPVLAADIKLRIKENTIRIDRISPIKDELNPALEKIFGKGVKVDTNFFASKKPWDELFDYSWPINSIVNNAELQEQCPTFDGLPLEFKWTEGCFIYSQGRPYWSYMIDRRKETPYVHHRIKPSVDVPGFIDIAEERDRTRGDALSHALPGAGFSRQR